MTDNFPLIALLELDPHPRGRECEAEGGIESPFSKSFQAGYVAFAQGHRLPDYEQGPRGPSWRAARRCWEGISSAALTDIFSASGTTRVNTGCVRSVRGCRLSVG